MMFPSCAVGCLIKFADIFPGKLTCIVKEIMKLVGGLERGLELRVRIAENIGS